MISSWFRNCQSLPVNNYQSCSIQEIEGETLSRKEILKVVLNPEGKATTADIMDTTTTRTKIATMEEEAARKDKKMITMSILKAVDADMRRRKTTTATRTKINTTTAITTTRTANAGTIVTAKEIRTTIETLIAATMATRDIQTREVMVKGAREDHSGGKVVVDKATVTRAMAMMVTAIKATATRVDGVNTPNAMGDIAMVETKATAVTRAIAAMKAMVVMKATARRVAAAIAEAATIVVLKQCLATR